MRQVRFRKDPETRATSCSTHEAPVPRQSTRATRHGRRNHLVENVHSGQQRDTSRNSASERRPLYVTVNVRRPRGRDNTIIHQTERRYTVCTTRVIQLQAQHVRTQQSSSYARPPSRGPSGAWGQQYGRCEITRARDTLTSEGPRGRPFRRREGSYCHGGPSVRGGQATRGGRGSIFCPVSVAACADRTRGDKLQYRYATCRQQWVVQLKVRVLRRQNILSHGFSYQQRGRNVPGQGVRSQQVHYKVYTS